ncbi:CPBP family intramembrane metalloprotease domain-containing protein [Plantibacter flavus]|uniref:CPBP family intramembrane glutamic endopeptidase n=2 Tax=Plantibacter TaxID=190323 RepID=UPI0010C188A6|nr:CPBP family intramembrane glutamic endopeptidase [Plantibacter flavus]TKJ96601.1 CPBP family intramembrane metalloprotease domain-containing protein [Plantibacter flavus]
MQRPDATPTEGGWAPLEQTAAGPVQTPVTGGSPAPAEAAAPVIGAAGLAALAQQPESAADRQRRRNRELAPILPTRVPWVAVTVFTVLAVGLAWLIAAPLWLSGEGLANPWFQLITLGMMYTPTIAALVVVLFVARPRSIPRLLGLAPLRPLGRTLGLCAAALVGFPVLAFCSMLLGQAMGLIQLDLVGLSGLAAIMTASGAGELGRDELTTVALVQLLTLPLGVLVASLSAFGEELGWRGWLLPNLLPLGTWPALLLSGAIWGVWHAPLILLGYNYQRTDVLGLLLMMGWCMLLGVLIGWLRLRSASVWPAVIAHGAVNAAVGALLLFASPTSMQDTGSVFGTLLGWPGWILLAATTLILVVTGQFGKRAVPGLRGSEVASPVS